MASLSLIGIAAAAVSLVFQGPGNGRAVLVSAAVAFISQVAAFPIVRKLARANLVAGWGTGSLIRFATLGAFALAANALQLPLTAALVSLALFYFLTMVIEPLFLRS